MTDTQTDIVTELKVLDPTNFRFKNQKALFTYSTHLDKEKSEAFFRGFSLEFKSIYIAHETGDSGYEHTHIGVDFGKALDIKNPRRFDFENIHPHIRVATKRDQWLRLCRYLTKEDKNVKLDITDKYNVIDRVLHSETLGDAFTHCRTLSEVQGAKTLFECKVKKMPEPRINFDSLWEWQQKIYDLLQQPPDNRTVIWLYDSVGKSGKTVFSQGLRLKYPEKYRFFNRIGKIDSFCMNLKTEIDNGFDGDVFFLNFSRGMKDKTFIYEALEMLKDGCITCTKYTGGTLFLNPVHVVVLANFMPDMDMLSKDRWAIYTIDKKTIRKQPTAFDWPEMAPKMPEATM